MKTIVLIFSFITLMYLGLWIWSIPMSFQFLNILNIQSEATDTKAVKTKVEKNVRPAEVKIKNEQSVFENEIQKVSEKVKPYQEYQAQQKWVEFSIKEGWAVSHGDIILGKPESMGEKSVGRAIGRKTRLWENGEVPFAIQAETPNKDKILKVLDLFNQKTNVRFVHFEGDEDAIVFVPGEDLCGSYLGRVGGHQPIIISSHCGERSISHEIMHALGFVHEQSRPDRDQYVEVLWENILPEAYEQFSIVPAIWLEDLHWNQEFSFRSVMLYSEMAFSKDERSPTLKSKNKEVINPSLEGPTKIDFQRINLLYSK